MKLRYTTFIGDGDAKSFACLTELKAYGKDVEIIKHECVGHVQKRMVMVLLKLKKSGIEDENDQLVRFKGRLTDMRLLPLMFIMGVPSETTKIMGWYKL